MVVGDERFELLDEFPMLTLVTPRKLDVDRPTSPMVASSVRWGGNVHAESARDSPLLPVAVDTVREHREIRFKHVVGESRNIRHDFVDG